MLKETSQKWIISRESYNEVIEIIGALDGFERIMDSQMMERTVFQITADTAGIQWLRVRKGDLDCRKSPICNATIKKRLDNHETKLISRLNLEDYTDAVSFFVAIGNKIASIQENKRTKYIFTQDSLKYAVCFDVWPHLDDLVFVSINCEQATIEDIIEVGNLLSIPQRCKKEFGGVDIDTVYQTRYMCKASEVPYLSFSLQNF